MVAARYLFVPFNRLNATTTDRLSFKKNWTRFDVLFFFCFCLGRFSNVVVFFLLVKFVEEIRSAGRTIEKFELNI